MSDRLVGVSRMTGWIAQVGRASETVERGVIGARRRSVKFGALHSLRFYA